MLTPLQSPSPAPEVPICAQSAVKGLRILALAFFTVPDRHLDGAMAGGRGRSRPCYRATPTAISRVPG